MTVTAKDLSLIACKRCTRVWPADTKTCARCGHRLARRDETGLQHVWAWWLMGLLCYIPANLYPMLQTRTLLFTQEDTIIGGALEILHHGSYGVAFIILLASVAIPIGKFIAIAVLSLSVRRGSHMNHHQRQHLYEIVEYIGRWSMIDIFVVAILSALVQLNTVAAINPGPASVFFALSVIFTMLSAQSFDPRMIWADYGDPQGPAVHE